MQRTSIHRILGLWFTALLVPLTGQAQEWECLQVEVDGTLSIGWEPDVLGASFYHVDHLWPAPDYVSFLQVAVDLAACRNDT